MRKLLTAVLTVFMLAGCNSAPAASAEPANSSGNHGCDAFEECESTTEAKTASGTAFKTEYEALNGMTNSSGKEHRTITIPETNPFVKTTPAEVIQKTEAGDSFWLYIGDPKCPWCRSVLETAAAKAAEYHVDQILYLNIWDEDGNEILRDKYVLEEGKPVKQSDGAPEYARMLELFHDVLSDYTLEAEDKTKVEIGEKRIFAPNFFRIEGGKAVRMTEGISEKQKDSREPLTDEILADEQKLFDAFFKG